MLHCTRPRTEYVSPRDAPAHGIRLAQGRAGQVAVVSGGIGVPMGPAGPCAAG
jgi:hypothetical protein